MDYSKLSKDELRGMLLEDKLNKVFMTKDIYELLLDYEDEFDEPNGKVINFCLNGLNQYEPYNENFPKPSFDKIFVRYEQKQRIKRKITVSRRIKRITIVTAVVLITVSLAEIVLLAFGFDMLEYVFNWGYKDTVEITNNSISTENLDDEIIIADYTKLDEIDVKWSNLVSKYILNNYNFINANYTKIGFDEFIINFGKNDKLLILTITNSPNTYVEKNDNEDIEEIVLNDIKFTFFKNIERNQVTWIYGDYLYILNTTLTIEEVKEIINNYY